MKKQLKRIGREAGAWAFANFYFVMAAACFLFAEWGAGVGLLIVSFYYKLDSLLEVLKRTEEHQRVAAATQQRMHIQNHFVEFASVNSPTDKSGGLK